jgi:hypothetical protein
MAVGFGIQRACSRLVHPQCLRNQKKGPELKAVNEARLSELEPSQTIVNLCQWEDVEAEADEMCDAIASPLEEFCGEQIATTMRNVARGRFPRPHSLVMARH